MSARISGGSPATRCQVLPLAIGTAATAVWNVARDTPYSSRNTNAIRIISLSTQGLRIQDALKDTIICGLARASAKTTRILT